MKCSVVLLFLISILVSSCDMSHRNEVKKLTFRKINLDPARDLVKNFMRVYPDTIQGKINSGYHTVYAVNIRKDENHTLQQTLNEHFPEVTFKEKVGQDASNVWIYNGLRFIRKKSAGQSGINKYFELLNIISLRGKDGTETFYEISNHVLDLRSFAAKVKVNKNKKSFHDSCRPECKGASLLGF